MTSSTKAIKALVSYPSLGYVGANVFDYHIMITDAAGTIVAESTASGSSGTSELFVDLSGGTYVYGTWNVNLRGDLGAQDQNTIMGSRVSLTLAQLVPQVLVSPTLPAFTATGTTTYFFQPGTAGPATSPEGCNMQAAAPKGGLATTQDTGTCQAGAMGYAVNYGADDPAVFTSAALAAPLTIGGNMSFTVYLADALQTIWQAGFNPRLAVEVNAVDADGDLLKAVAAGEFTVCNGGVCNTGPTATRGIYTLLRVTRRVYLTTTPAEECAVVTEGEAVLDSGRDFSKPAGRDVGLSKAVGAPPVQRPVLSQADAVAGGRGNGVESDISRRIQLMTGTVIAPAHYAASRIANA